MVSEGRGGPEQLIHDKPACSRALATRISPTVPVAFSARGCGAWAA